MRRIVALVAFASMSCNAWQNIQCEQSSNCDLSAGGECLVAATGNLWCAYPDPSCSGGYRYSNQAVGDGLSGVCVPMTGSGSGSDSGFNCGSDADCAGMSGTPYCAPSGACVACLGDSACTSADAPVCDGSANVCRGCEQDSECASGICLESNGTCADAQDVIFVSDTGADVGDCSEVSPCLTLNYAMTEMEAPRNVIRIMSSDLLVSATVTTNVITSGYIDGNMTVITRSGSGYLINIDGGNLAISGVVIDPHPDGSGVEIEAGLGSFYNATVKGDVEVSGGELDAFSSTILSVEATGNARLDIEDSYLSTVSAAAGTLERNTFDDTSGGTFGPDAKLDITGPFTIENNVVISSDGYDDPLHLGSGGGVFRFNTVVNLSGEDFTATPIECDLSEITTVSNNIIAWHTSTPPGCSTIYTLYDDVEALPPGDGNQIGSASTFFIDMADKNFHLAAGSPAIGAAQPSACAAVSIDHDGSAQPGSNCAVGAYEAP